MSAIDVVAVLGQKILFKPAQERMEYFMMQKKFSYKGIATRVVHGGRNFQDGLAQAIKTHLRTATQIAAGSFESNSFAIEEIKKIYLRLADPDRTLLEDRICEIEGGQAAQAVSSGCDAIAQTVLNICESGNEFIASTNLYGSTELLFNLVLPRCNIRAKLVDMHSLDQIEAAINERTRMIYLETLDQPLLTIADIESVARLAQKHQLPLVVDATFTPPSLLRPILFGANIVIHALDMWYSGCSTLPGGIVIDAGNFNWADAKFSLYNEPSNYHGLRFAHDLGDLNGLAFILRLRMVGLRTISSPLAADIARRTIRAISTLELRVSRQSSNAATVANFLQQHPLVKEVYYPGKAALASKYLPNGGGGMISFALRGGLPACQKLMESLCLLSNSVEIGGVNSLALHPASPTPDHLTTTALHRGDVRQDLIYLSLGIEDVNDIIDDIAKGLGKI